MRSVFSLIHFAVSLDVLFFAMSSHLGSAVAARVSTHTHTHTCTEMPVTRSSVHYIKKCVSWYIMVLVVNKRP